MKLLVSLLVAGTLLLSGSFVILAQTDDCSGLIVAKCASCHSLKRVCRALGKKDLAQWQKTNERMVKKGMTVTDEELVRINKYLSGATSDDAICQ
ncbi:hypothetical protein [Maridesulfovibrio ferrireducens]|uniref:hypothetical protein n=1 Tax=Maridesulfovibrio ferrireducens TaxID=246191 RepID=UPI001A1F996C|nr:hypothetical protein [Maridesulfovibrio ferrireducens]MBI9110537.1 hypothetical protein [Maridesulfovibrio ferrireducens]